jgi:threonine/homoserine/homoserine lactone efflux protein
MQHNWSRYLRVIIAGLAGTTLTGLIFGYPLLGLLTGLVAYLAWTLVRPTRVLPASGEIKVAHPLTFLQAAMFQWVNPKAWLMMITAIATYTQPATMAGNVAVIALLFVMVGMPCISVWNLFGASLRTFLQDARRARAFNIGMAVLLMGSMYPLLQ